MSHILCGCSKLAQSMYKARQGRMLRLIYNAMLDKYGHEESQCRLPWYKQTPPQPCQKGNQVKILWDIPWQVEKAPKLGAKRPDIKALGKNNKEWILVEGNVCTPATIAARTKHKQDK